MEKSKTSSLIIGLLIAIFIKSTGSICEFTPPFPGLAQTNQNVSASTGVYTATNWGVMTVDFGDSTMLADICYSQKPSNTLSHAYADPDLYSASGRMYNDVGTCNETFDANIIVQDPIIGFTVSGPRYTTTEDISTFKAEVTSGSDIKVAVSWSDGTPSTVEIWQSKLGNEQPFKINHSFTQQNTFVVNFNASNLLSSSVSTPVTVTVLEKVKSIILEVISPLTWVPGSVTFSVGPGTDQKPLSDIHCNWTAGLAPYPVSASVSQLSASSPFQFTYTFKIEEYGNQSVVATCYNMASSSAANIVLNIDTINLKSLSYPSGTKIYFNRTTTFTLGIEHFGSGSCFEWDMGDGTPHFLYQDGTCSNAVATVNPTIVQFASPLSAINHPYFYAQPGTYTIKVNAFNSISNDTQSISVTALEWTCFTPVVAVQDIFSNQLTPYTTTVMTGFSVNSSITVDCMKSESMTRQWKLFVANDLQNSLQTSPDSEVFNCPPESLMAGKYVIELTVSLHSQSFDLSNFTVVKYAYVTLTDNVVLDSLKVDASLEPFFWNMSVTFTLKVAQLGNRSCFEWDMGDNSSPLVYQGIACSGPILAESPTYVSNVASLSTIIRTYAYTDTGTFTVTVRGFNYASNDSLSLVVTILEWTCDEPTVSIDEVYLIEGIPFNISVFEQLTIAPNTSFSCMKMESAVYQWEVFTSQDYSADQFSSPLLVVLGVEQLAFPLNLQAGRYAVSYNVSMFSHYFDLRNYTIIKYIFLNLTDDLVLESLTYDTSLSPIYWNTTVTFYLKIAKIGSGACFDWDMGDGSKDVIYRGTVCSGVITADNPIYTPTVIPVFTINHSYWFPNPGTWEVEVRGFNYASNSSLTVSVTILDLPCEKPIVTIDSQFENEVGPYNTTVNDGFTIGSNISVSCRKTELIIILWELFDAIAFSADPLTTAMQTVPNSDTFLSPPNNLLAGNYVVRLNVSYYNSFFDLGNFTVLRTAYVTLTDDVILESLTYNTSMNPIYWNTTVAFHLNVSRYGNGTCLEWEMGDNSRHVVYQAPFCSGNVEASNPIFVPVSAETFVVERRYWYGDFGFYTVRVRGFNYASTANLTVNITILEWPCTKPNVTIEEKYLNASAPYTILVPVGFTINSNVSVDCMKNEGVARKWEIFDVRQFTTNPTAAPFEKLLNSDVYHSPPRALQAGQYVIRLNVSIYNHYFDMSNYTVIVLAYVTINQSPLEVAFEGGPTILSVFNSSLYISALNLTFDPDVLDPTDKTGLTWKWLCKREGEEWPSSLPVVPYQSYYGSSENGGCFGDGPGIVDFRELTLSLDSSYFMALVNYTLELRVVKDVRNASASLFLFVTDGKKPILEISCETNCRDQVITQYSLALRARCVDNCFNRLGQVTVWWELYIGGANPTDPYSLYSDLASTTIQPGETTSMGLFIKPNIFKPSLYHKLVVYGQTPHSLNGSMEYVFKTNSPPSGGTCAVSPTEGYAGVTQFSVSCQNWISSEAVGGSSSLTYFYAIGPWSATDDSQLDVFYYGANADSGLTTLSLGNSLDGFRSIVMATITDVNGDSVEYQSQEIKVLPPQDTSDEHTLDGFLDSAIAAVDKGELTENDPKVVCSNILVVLSLLNGLNETADETNPSTGQNNDVDYSSSDDPYKLGGALKPTDYDYSDPDGSFTGSGETGSGGTGSGGTGSGGTGSGGTGSGGIGSGGTGSGGTTSGGTGSGGTGNGGSGKTLTPQQIASREKEANLRLSYIDAMDDLPMDSTTALKQRRAMIKAVLNKPSVVTPMSMEKAYHVIVKMYHKFVALQPNLTIEEQVDSAKDILLTALALGEASNAMISAGTYLNATSGTTSESIRAQVADSAKTIWQTLMDLAQRFLDKKYCGDPQTAIESAYRVVMTVDRKSLTNLKESDLSSSLGQMSLEDYQSNDSCSDRVTVQARSNLIVWDPSSSNVTSPLSYMAVKTEGSGFAKEVRRRRSLTSVSQGNSIHVGMLTATNRGPLVSRNTSDIYGMIHHIYNLTYAGLYPTILRVTPAMPTGSNDTLLVYVRADERPTPDLYDWVMVTYNRSNNYTLFLTAYQTTNVTRLFVSVQSTAGCVNTTLCGRKVVVPLRYYIYFQEVSCSVWLDNEQRWAPGDCQITSGMPGKVSFHSNLLGGFGTGFVTPINTIDFNTLFDNLGQKLIDSACVWGTIIAILVLYVLLAVLLRRLDRRDLFKWYILPLADNWGEDENLYELHVHTGFSRHSGTKSKVFFRLFGTQSETGVRAMEDGFRQNFGRGEVSSFAMKTPECLGTPLKLEVWHDNSGGKEADWFLSKVVLVDVQKRFWYLFTCEDWLSVVKGRGQTRRYLTVSQSYAYPDSSLLVRRNVSQRIFEDHMWLSVGFRAKKSLFTREQRLGACMATLFLAMITNCMFFRDASEEEPAQKIQIGPITITGPQMFASIITSLIVFPPILVITILFSKSKEKGEGPRLAVDGYRTATTIGVGKLPHWCTYIAWALVALCISLSAIFTIFYSMQWGRVKSQSWLQAFILSFIESAILIQPLKVVVVALLVSFILKQDPDVHEYEDKLGRMQTVQLSDFDDRCLSGDMPVENIRGQEETKRLQRKAELDDKMKTMIREVLFYVIFLLLLLIVVNGQVDNWSYRQNKHLAGIFTAQCLAKITCVQKGLWFWARTELLPNIYYTLDYNGKETSYYDRNYIFDMNAWRLGPPRLRQLRVTTERCPHVSNLVRRFRCTNSYSYSFEETKPFSPGWIPVKNVSAMLSNQDDLTDIQKAFLHSTEKNLNANSFQGQLVMYSGGGYVANLGMTLDSANQMIADLERTRWIDFYTRAVFVEFNVFNPGSGLANLVLVLCELSTDGNVIWSHRMETVQLYRYTGGSGVVNLVSEILCAIFVVVITILELRKIFRLRSAYFRSFWNWTQIIALVMFFVSVGLYTVRCLWTMWVVEDLMNNPGKLVSFTPILRYNEVYLILMSFVAFLTQCQLLHLLRYNQTIAILGNTLSHSATTLLSFGALSLIVFMAFSIGAYLMFFGIEPYQSLFATLQSQLEAFLGKFDFGELVSSYGKAAGCYLLIYLLTMIVFVTNLFIAIINEFLYEFGSNRMLQNKDFEVIDHFLGTVKGFLVPPSRTTKRSGGENDQENRSTSLNDLSKRINYLDDVVEVMIRNAIALEKSDDLLLNSVLKK